MVRVPLWDRVWPRLRWTETDCWEWEGALASGYGVVQASTKNRQYVHRLVYERLVGKIPDGLHIDHLCRNRRCANPKHLEPVACRTNVLRSPVAPAALNAAKTTCANGHSYDYVSPDGDRHCKTCRLDYKRRWRAAGGKS